MARAEYLVVPDGTGWTVMLGPEKVAGSPRKAEATEAAKRLAMAHPPSRVVVHGYGRSPEAEWTFEVAPREA
jgi:hypothetical protein